MIENSWYAFFIRYVALISALVKNKITNLILE